MYTSFVKLPFTTDPIEIVQLVPKIWTVEGLQKQYEMGEIVCFVWLYLKISICKFLPGVARTFETGGSQSP